MFHFYSLLQMPRAIRETKYMASGEIETAFKKFFSGYRSWRLRR